MSSIYVPQTSIDGVTWNFINVKKLQNTKLLPLASSLSKLFEDGDGIVLYQQEKIIGFKSEFCVMSFLGGAKSYLSTEDKIFEI